MLGVQRFGASRERTKHRSVHGCHVRRPPVLTVNARRFHMADTGDSGVAFVEQRRQVVGLDERHATALDCDVDH